MILCVPMRVQRDSDSEQGRDVGLLLLVADGADCPIGMGTDSLASASRDPRLLIRIRMMWRAGRRLVCQMTGLRRIRGGVSLRALWECGCLCSDRMYQRARAVPSSSPSPTRMKHLRNADAGCPRSDCSGDWFCSLLTSVERSP